MRPLLREVVRVTAAAARKPVQSFSPLSIEIAVRHRHSYYKIRYHAVAGTSGIQEGLTVPTKEVFGLAFGDHRSDAHGDFDEALKKVLSLAIQTLKNAGSIWIAEAGQSGFSAAPIRKIRERILESSVKDRIHVFRHAD